MSARPGNRVPHDDRHHLLLDELHHGLQQLRALHLVAIQAAHQILPGVPDDLAGQRQLAEQVEGARIEFEGALVLQLADDVLLHQLQRRLRVDEVVVEDLLQRDERVVGLLLEDLVAVARQRGVEVGGPLLPELAEPGAFGPPRCARALRARASAGGRCSPPRPRRAP